MADVLILAADVGGTHARLLLGVLTGDGWQPVRQQVFASREHPTFDAVLSAFIQPGERITAACFGIAGPVIEQRAAITHLPWQLDAVQLARHHGIAQVQLHNDFVVQAHGLPLLSPNDVLTLQAGKPERGGVRLLVGAGTGLGIATLVQCDDELHVVASEGGHAGFAPRNAQQLALAGYLLQHGAVLSLESVLSGRGLENIYRFVLHEQGVAGIAPLAAPAISAAAAQGDSLAMDAIALFGEVYGSAVGDLALINLATAGVYVSGGIAAKLADRLAQGAFLPAFRDKGFKRALMADIPLHVVRNEYLGLLGAATVAARLAKAQR